MQHLRSLSKKPKLIIKSINLEFHKSNAFKKNVRKLRNERKRVRENLINC